MLERVGRLTRSEDRRTVRVSLSCLRDGLQTHPDGFLVLAVSDDAGALEVRRVVPSACAHASGTLVPTAGGRARCANHGWELDVERCAYTNVQRSVRELDWVAEGDELVVSVPRSARSLEDGLRPRKNVPVEVRYLAHACVALEAGGLRIVVDPWLVGPCFLGGWWHAHAVPSDALTTLLGADAVFISHNHPDHLHEETLARLPRETLMLVPDFPSGSVARALRSLGFTRVQALGEDEVFAVGDVLRLACLFAGDGRDDSGLYVAGAAADILLTVDANRLGGMALPADIDLLLTSFASGASGFPVCFDVVSTARCEAIVNRNRHAARDAAASYVRATRARAWMPYAGYFTEADPRDASVRAQNAKNSPDDVADALKARFPGLQTISPLVYPRVAVVEHQVEVRGEASTPADATHSVGAWRASTRAAVGSLDEPRLEAFLRGAGFRDDLVLLIVATDDAFVPGVRPAWCVDFRDAAVVQRIAAADAFARLAEARAAERTSPRFLLLRAREDVLAHVVARDRPWEELTIGFQCRVDRYPDVYNSAFWEHFTNILPGRVHG